MPPSPLFSTRSRIPAEQPEEPLEGSGAPRKAIFADLGGAKGLKLAVDNFYKKEMAGGAFWGELHWCRAVS